MDEAVSVAAEAASVAVVVMGSPEVEATAAATVVGAVEALLPTDALLAFLPNSTW